MNEIFNKIEKNQNENNNIFEISEKDSTNFDTQNPSNINSKNNKSDNNIIIKDSSDNNKDNINNIKNFNNYNFHDNKNNNTINNLSNSPCNENNNKDNKNLEINNDNDNFEELNFSKYFKNKLGKKKDKDKDKDKDIFDFENIELPKEKEREGFTEINCPVILNNKKEEETNEKNNQKNNLLNFFNNRATFIKSSNNNIYLNYFDKINKDNIGFENLYKTSYIQGKENKSINLVKTMAVLKSSNNWTWKDNLKSFVSTLYYNGYSLSTKFERESPVLPIYIFDTELNEVNLDEMNRLLKTFLYMSYRSGFINLNCLGCGDYTSDCGWGCMLRCSQMILSKGFIQKKIFDFFQEKNTIIDNISMENIRKETLDLFNDNYLPFKEIKNHPDFHYFWNIYKDIIKKNPEYNSISEIIPPYSIHILCKLGKFSGEYTSDIKMIKLFSLINSQIFNDINIVLFECGLISKKKLITYFCEEYTDFNSNYFDTITYNGVDYIFKKGGIVFISFRFGLYQIEPIYYKVIPLLFEKFHNNLGFISGKNNKAYYFIGIQGKNKLIFVDPHYNQQTTNNFERDYGTYYTENLYLLDVKELASELTLGIGIYNSRQFSQFLDELKWFKDNFKDLNFLNID